MDDFIHHLVHLGLYSLVIWQIVLGIYIILIWAKRNIKFNISPTINNVSENRTDYPIEVLKDKLEGKRVGPTGPVEIDIKKNIIVDDVDKSDLSKSSEIKKGKVKTQKDKLKALRK